MPPARSLGEPLEVPAGVLPGIGSTWWRQPGGSREKQFAFLPPTFSPTQAWAMPAANALVGGGGRHSALVLFFQVIYCAELSQISALCLGFNM